MPSTRSALLAVTVVLGLGAIAGCEDASKGGAASAPPTITSAAPSPLVSSSPADPTTSAADAPSQSPSPSPPASPSPAPGGSLSGRLLTAAELPGFNAGYRWTEGTTRGREPRRLVGTCQKFPLTSIGATQVAYRSFDPPARSLDSAEQLVAEFPDETTARRAWAVLTSWRAQCKSRLRGYRTSQVGALKPVGVDGGDGGWYLLVYGPAPGDPDSGVFDAQGMAVVGSRISMIELKSVGQDYDYPPGKEPMVSAVQQAAAKLSGE
jgi:hypothetical protein